MTGSMTIRRTESQEDIAAYEKRVELKKILASEVFLPHAKTAAFLDFIANKAIAGETVMEPDIREALFSDEGYEPGSNLVRQHKRKCRELLKTYYQTRGVTIPCS